MDDALTLSRVQFALTISFHYVFVQLTLGLGLFIVLFKTRALREGRKDLARAAQFWARVFALSFGFGVVTGIPLEFQFGTNWSAFSRQTGGVIGQTLAMEGMFSFFLESSFLGLFLFGEKWLSPRAHWLCAVLVLVGSWSSSFFIIATNAFMQHPADGIYSIAADGSFQLESLSALLGNPWLPAQLAHTVCGAVVTGAFVVAGVGAFYLLSRRDEEQGRTFVKTGMIVGLVASILCAFPTGDAQVKLVHKHQGPTFAAMEGHFRTRTGAPIVLIGQPDMEEMKLDNPLELPGALSILTHRRWNAEVKGLEHFDKDTWPENIPLLYFSYHIMAGLGTIFVLVTSLGAFQLWRGRLFKSRKLLWTFLLMWPLPFIANTAGWVTTETGRQPWLVYGALRTANGVSPELSSGNAMFTLLGFAGLYLLLGILFLILVGRAVAQGPSHAPGEHH
ncbi:MAG: cytochrome ubiquinol oxidase subunit I [Planctomycetes bacterium]|nr:cytochrome ubiquinol oxidase subunit I [Planctomycetota bacterium]